MVNKKSHIFIAGHKGLVGASIYNRLKQSGYKNLIIVDKKKLDLTDEREVINYFRKKKIDYMIMAAARVGGIMANKTYKADFYLENCSIQNNLLKLAVIKKIKRTVFLGTSCIYPKYCKTPIKEEYLLSGRLEKTNETYALAKIGGIKLSEALFKQQGLDIVCLMPTNLYGTNDKFGSFASHVIPGMISKIIKAKKTNKKTVKLLGTGKPLREFLYVDDLADAIYLIINLSKQKIKKVSKGEFPMFNVGSGKNISIKNLSYLIKKKVGFKGKVLFDRISPDGTMKKNLDSSKIRKFGWNPKINLDKGLSEVIKLFL
jgi:GDP-L-fucose synthase